MIDGADRGRPVLIAGPTASGKSRLALALAGRLAARGERAVIVNADSMQNYAALRVLTARPSAAEEDAAPHRLFGHVGDRVYSVGAWLSDMARVLVDAEAAGARPIVVGGTGLYFRALTEGLADIPEVPPAIRRHWRERLLAEGSAALHRVLAERDGHEAARLRPSDRQRIVRALEVLEGTGRALAAWQSEARGPALIPLASAAAILVALDRERLYANIRARFTAMVQDGALDEVAALPGHVSDPDHPLRRAIGVPELSDHLAGRIDLETATERGVAATRAYAKRQRTWFSAHMDEWSVLTLDDGDVGAAAARITG